MCDPRQTVLKLREMGEKCDASVDAGVGYGDGEITATDADRGDEATSLSKHSGTRDGAYGCIWREMRRGTS